VPASVYGKDVEIGEDGDSKSGLSMRSRIIQPQQRDNMKEVEQDEGSTISLLFMRGCSMMIDSYLTGRNSKDCSRNQKVKLIDDVVALAELLHCTLFHLQSCGSLGLKTQTNILSTCEMWWHSNFSKKELFITQLVPLLLQRTLDTVATKSDVIRVFKIRNALCLFDFEDDSIDHLRSLILRTISRPLYLRCKEGLRSISHFFQLDPSLVIILHQAIKAQISVSQKTILQTYAEIYHRAWKASEDNPLIRTSIEENALQDLMFSAIHIGSPQMFKSILIVLEPFHCKKNSQLECLLQKMYAPIIWRALSAANPLVRANATAILAESFPLGDVEKSIGALVKLLTDDDPRVRIQASKAVGNTLGLFWDAVEAKEIRALLNILITKHSSDATSPRVRSTCVSSITHLLSFTKSHAVLRPLLPSLGNLIHDSNESVRLSVVRMLAYIKAIPGIKYYHVVNLDHLLARLGKEDGSVASALTHLLLNSYFPQGVSNAEQARRTFAFLADYPDAAVVFYRNISNHLSVNFVAKLAKIMLKCFGGAIDNEKKGRKRRRSHKNEEKEDDGAFTAENTTLMASIAETICCLWEGISKTVALPKNEPVYEYLRDAFSGPILANNYSHFLEKSISCDPSEESKINDCQRTCTAIVRVAGFMPPDEVTDFTCHLKDLLKESNNKNNSNDNISPHIALLCLWGRTDDICTSFAKAISSHFYKGEPDDLFSNSPAVTKKRKSRKSWSVGNFSEFKPGRALDVLGGLLVGSDPTCKAAREAIFRSEISCSAIEYALEGAIFAADRLLNTAAKNFTMTEDEVSMILSAFELYGRYIIHKQAASEPPLRLSSQSFTLLNFVSNKVVPFLMCTPDKECSPIPFLDISGISSNSSPRRSAPPAKKPNLSITPIRKDSINSFRLSDIRCSNSFSLDMADATSIYATAAAISLIQSATFLFSEWLDLEGEGVSEIKQHVTMWCEVLKTASRNINVRRELLPSFCRMMIRFVKLGEYQMVKQILILCEDIEEEEILLRKAIGIVIIISCRTSKLDCFFEIILDNAFWQSQISSDGVPSTTAELCDNCKGAIAIALDAIHSSVQGGLQFARYLSNRILLCYYSDHGDDDILFEAKCLYVLCKQIPKGKHAVEIRRIANNVAAECDIKDNNLADVLTSLSELELQ